MEIQIKHLPEYQVAYLRHIGPYDYESIRIVFNQLIFWAQNNGLMNDQSIIMGVNQNNPYFRSKKKCNFDACITVPKNFQNTSIVKLQKISGGLFAVYPCEVFNNNFKKPWNDLIFKWLIQSDYRPDKRPSYIIYHNNAQEYREKKWQVDFCLSIKPCFQESFPCNMDQPEISMALSP